MYKIEDTLIWGEDLYEYVKKCHILSKELKKNYTIGINGPDGIGKLDHIKKFSHTLGRTFIEFNYNDICADSSLKVDRLMDEMTQNPLLVYVRNTLICDCSYTKEIREFIKEIESKNLKENVIFVISSETTIGSNTQLKAEFRVFRYGRLSLAEKVQYANQFIFKCQNQLGLSQVSIPESTLKILIGDYTKEAGINYLFVLIRDIYETVYYSQLNEKEKNSNMDITAQMIYKILGRGCFTVDEKIAKNNKQGIGMAYTNWGGILLPIQISVSKGNGNICITGNIGSIMKESIEVVFEYLKTHNEVWNIPENYFIKNNFYISVSELALYKDGASAGLAFFIKIVCTIKNIYFRDAIAYSGEISLEGRVLRIGGLKEKICSAQEQEFKKFVLPKQALPEYQCLPEELRSSITTYFIEDVMDVIEIIEREKDTDLCKEY